MLMGSSQTPSDPLSLFLPLGTLGQGHMLAVTAPPSGPALPLPLPGCGPKEEAALCPAFFLPLSTSCPLCGAVPCHFVFSPPPIPAHPSVQSKWSLPSQTQAHVGASGPWASLEAPWGMSSGSPKREGSRCRKGLGPPVPPDGAALAWPALSSLPPSQLLPSPTWL